MPDFNYFPGRNVCWFVCCYFPLYFFGGSRSSDVSWSQIWKSTCVNELRRHQVVRDNRLGRGLCTEDELILGFVIKNLKEALYILSIDPLKQADSMQALISLLSLEMCPKHSMCCGPWGSICVSQSFSCFRSCQGCS